MNLSSKLTSAMIFVVLLVVAGHVAYSVYLDYRTTRMDAGAACQEASAKLNGALKASQDLTLEVAKGLVGSERFISAYNAGDKGGVAGEIKSVCERFSFSGHVWVVDDKGNLFYGSDTPKASGHSVLRENYGIEVAHGNNDPRKFWSGVTFNDKTKVVALSTVLSMGNRGHNGILAVSLPINTDFLTGLATRFGIENPNSQGIELAVFSNKEGKVTAFSENMNDGTAIKFLPTLNSSGLKAIPKAALEDGASGAKPGFEFSVEGLTRLLVPTLGFEREYAWWRTLGLTAKDNQDVVAYILIAKDVPSEFSKIVETTLLGGLVGVLGIVVGMLFSSQITASVDRPVRFLIKRTRDIASNKQVIPPLENLSGDWLELGELIDTAVLSMRSTTQNLKQQLNKQAESVKEKIALAEQSNQQADLLNRNIAHQAKQIAEYKGQMNQATRQAIIVQQQLDAVLQCSTEGFLVLDQFGNILHANTVFLNWYGSSEGEIAGRMCFDLVRKPGDPPTGDSQGQAFAQHGGDPHALISQFYPEGTIYHKGGQKKVDVLAHLQPLSGDDSNIQGYIMVLRDKSLRSENAHLRQEIINMLQENIRAPLTQAESGWSAIMSNAAGPVPPSTGQALNDLHGQYQQLIALVDNLLMMYGGFVPPPAVQPKEQITISRLVADCLQEVTPMARERQLMLDYKTVTGLPNISGNKEAITGILLQVLERMIDITGAGGRVRVESLSKGQEMRIGVSSSGPALPEGEIADMFVGYIEGKHAEHTYGSRLSMYLARNNVERLGGKIWAESEAGRGTITYFTLPIAPN
ncbi:MAG: PAS domain-containing sensor histidine kinase [Cyanobacteria bacterium SZAS TMP-1]|nr:PAS domain-containing sensor histidine kinase [Cyanobacteria bacterium SZAS TMP-1]